MTAEVLTSRIEKPFARLIGDTGQDPRYVISRWLFLRALGAVYLIAFWSLWIQVQGLIGPDGILPAGEYLDMVRQGLGAERYHLVPSFFWLGAGTGALRLVTGLGLLGATLLILDVWPRGVLVALWALYLSLVAVGQDFLSFQWDVLLLEAGVLAVLLAPGHLLPRRALETPPSPLAVALLWGLLFRLVFESGAVKLTSGDPTWRNFTALDYHFFTQPLPTWTAWYANLLPSWVKRGCTFTTLVLELGAPLLIFFGRRPRLAGWAGIVGLQLLILGTGNYTFFNLLTIALSLLLLDDSIWRRVLPRLAGWLVPAQLPVRARAGPRLAIATFAIVLLPLQVGSFIEAVGPSGSTPVSLERALEWLAPFRSVNGYGLFRVMTTERAEIILEGSLDGAAWRAYQFRYKPGALEARPGFVQPHQPRLDWQMWFAALDRFGRTSWVQAFMARLLEGSPPVVGLLASNPFPDRPPKYLRATLYDYRFTDWATRSATKAWWVRTELGPYSPVVSLADSTAAPR